MNKDNSVYGIYFSSAMLKKKNPEIVGPKTVFTYCPISTT